ncbi:type VI secretion system ImpA family N-terminal domain-containing protein [Erwinia sp. CGal63]|uniref:type VI secretion system ImpA family N-terminal domain-containing protein n=1 Tax=Erwinia sp. CGal63 TaxID=2919889 RepID=UPI00300B4C5B
MTTPGDNILHTGSDPRALAEFSALRQEIALMAGEPGPNWQRVERLAIALFRANGMDLQSVAWYTLARAYCAGLPGLCEGFEIVTAMLKHQWATLWPQPLPARLAIVTWLSVGMQQVLRKLPSEEYDLDLLYRLQAQLEQNIRTLEALAHKHLSQLDRLAIQLSNLITQLALPESQPTASQTTLAMATMAQRAGHSDEFTPLIYVPRDLTSSSALNVSFSLWERSRGFLAGMLLAVLLCALGLWVFQLAEPVPGKAQRIAMLAQQLTPELASQEKNWQADAATVALPVEQLALWHTARLRLQKLLTTVAVQEAQRKECLSYPELEAQLMTIRQPLEEMQPVEELLRQLEADKHSPVLRGKTEHRLKQLMARYALILQADEKDAAQK